MSSKGDKDVLVAVQVRLGTLDETATPWTQWLEAMELLLGEQHPLIPNALARDGLGLELRVFVPRGIPETGESAAARDVRIAENVRDEKRIYDKNEDKLKSAHQFFSTMLRACTERMVEAVRTDSLLESSIRRKTLLDCSNYWSSYRRLRKGHLLMKQLRRLKLHFSMRECKGVRTYQIGRKG